MASYCTGKDEHIVVTMVDSKVWHDDDMYLMICTKCGKKEKCLARRGRDTITMCGDNQ